MILVFDKKNFQNKYHAAFEESVRMECDGNERNRNRRRQKSQSIGIPNAQNTKTVRSARVPKKSTLQISK